MNIYWKLISFCLFLILLTSGSLYYFANLEAQIILEKQIIADLSQKSAQSMRNIERFMYERITDVKSLSIQPLFRDTTSSPESIQAYFQQLHQIDTTYYSFSYFNMDRVRKVDSKGLSVGKQHPNTTYWLEISNGKKIVMDISKSVSTGKIVIHFAAVVEDKNNQPCGVVVARVLIDRLYDVFQEIPYNDNLQESIDIDLLDKKGTILYSNHQAEKVLTEEYEGIDRFYDSNSQKEPILLENQGNLLFYVKEDGSHYKGYLSNEWALVVNVPTYKAFNTLSQITHSLIWVLLPILAVGVLLSVLMAGFFSRPILKLTKAAKKIGEEEWDVDTKVNTGDELSILGRELDKMGNKLKKKTQSLLTQNEEMTQQHEEIMAQRDFIDKRNHELEQKNEQIRHSIRAGKMIQDSILPGKQHFEGIFQDFFILFRPKDVISGDFYWIDEINDQIVLAVVDCTGHGVEGGFMSMVVKNILDNVIKAGQSNDPASILEKMNQLLIRSLKQEENGNNYGADASLVVLKYQGESVNISYAGAKRPMYYIENGQSFLETIKGDRIFLGGYSPNERRFQTHHLKLPRGSRLYFGSDGFSDQNNSQRQKIGEKKLKELLLQTSNDCMQAQEETLNKELEKHLQLTPQRDDILIIGLQL